METLSGVLREYWDFPVLSIRQLPQGVNSLTRVVETARERLVVHARPATPRISYEHGLLAHLARQALPFAVPVPVPARNGATWVEIDGTAFAVTPWIPGNSPEESRLEQAQACGTALAELDVVLASAPGGELPLASPHVQPAVDQWPIDARHREALLGVFERTRTAAPRLDALPRQTIHRDFDQSNVLMEGDRVTGILDFEFSGTDVRALDLTYALSQWPGRFKTTAKGWPVIQAFVRGYRAVLPLTDAEIDAVPDVLRRRWATTLTFRQARCEQGLVSEADLCAEATELARSSLWLDSHEDTLRDQIRTGARP